MKEKDYKKWHTKKSLINDLVERPEFNERDIWFCYLGLNIGFEQDGSPEEFMRPVLIFKKFNNETFWAIPMTKSQKVRSPNSDKYYYHFSFVEGIMSAVILSQLRLIDARRLSRRIGRMAEAEFEKLKEKLRALCT